MKKSQIARQERNAQLVKNIVEATKPLLLQQGYEDLTIREICANAGITTGMFYRHFVSKDDVLSFCYMQAHSLSHQFTFYFLFFSFTNKLYH